MKPPFGQPAPDLAGARLRGMKIRARLDPPRAATGTFPWPHRTCAEWMDECSPSVPTDNVRYDSRMFKKNAIEGSAQLRDAIKRSAA